MDIDFSKLTKEQWLEIAQIAIKHTAISSNQEDSDGETMSLESVDYQAIQEDVTNFIATSKKRPLTINPFQDGYTSSPSSQPVQGVVRAIQGAASSKKGWREQKGMGPQFTHHNSKGITNIEYNPTDRKTQLTPTVTTSLWKEIEQFSDKDVDTLLIALAYLATSKESSVWMFASDTLDHRGIVPIMKKEDGKERRAGHRTEDIADFELSLYRISHIWVTIRQEIHDDGIDKKTNRRKKKQYTHAGKLFSINEEFYQKELNLDTGAYENRQAIGWRIQGGDWLQTFLDFPNRQIASLCQAILKYDPKNEQWEKRLGYYFFFHGHMSKPQGGSTKLNRSIKDMLEVNSIEVNTRDPQRTRNRFEKAMNRLAKDGIINAWDYKEDINIPPKRWLEIWLNQTVSIDITTKKALS